MTTIAYRDGFIASDRQLSYGDYTPGCVQKIFETPTFTIAACGVLSDIYQFVQLMRGDRESCEFKEAGEGFDAIVVDKETKKVVIYDQDLFPIPLEAPFYAFGSGKKFALGAMEMGASAREAVKVASKYDIYTNHLVKVVKVK